MYRIAIKMLLGDRSKYIMLVSALTFAALLMTQQIGVFVGLMRWTTATLRNSYAEIWVVDPTVQQLNEVKPMRDTDLSRVRSVEGVKWAVPLYQGVQQVRIADGRSKSILFLGLDPATLIGLPPIISGSSQDLLQDNAIFIDKLGTKLLSTDPKKPLKIGDIFEINDHEVRIVGILDTERSFFGYPYVYTTYERALNFIPKVRKNLSFVLVKPKEGLDPSTVARSIEIETGLRAYTEHEFFWATIVWFFKNTGIPISFGITILLGFVVGMAVAGQTFYMFILENLRNLGALKAMGASDGLIAKMLMLQALFVGFIGYGIGIGLASIFGWYAVEKKEPPFFITFEVLLFIFSSILFICIISALIGIRKIQKLDVSEVFHA